MIPKNKTAYNYFDDGKISKTRMSRVWITDIKPFEKVEDFLIIKWENETKNHPNLFAEKTDFFIKGKIEDTNEFLIFVRTTDNGWFSFNNNMWDGRLDVSNKLTEQLNEA